MKLVVKMEFSDKIV